MSELKGMAKQAEETNVTSYGIVVTALFVSTIGIVSCIYRMDRVYQIVIMLVGLGVVPLIIFYHYYQKRENIRFNQVDVYIHQMAYSFQRSPKIITALKDTYRIAEGNLKEVVLRAAACMESDDSPQIYREALAIIEREYPCDRIYTLHRFLISIEERGGEYSQPLAILLEDFDRWVRRVYKYQEDMKHVKINSSIGIIISCVLASMSIMISTMLGDTAVISMDITHLDTYQVETLCYMIFNVVYFVYVLVHYSRDWITPVRDDKKIMKDYKVAFSNQSKALNIARWVILAVMVILAFGAYKLFGAFQACTVGIIGLVLYFMPLINKNRAMERLKDDVYTGFSEWLREVAVNLSHAPLQAAIQESYATCPAVIKPSLARFIFELDENPADVTPYYTFLKEFRILDISSTVKTLYSITENETQNLSEVIGNLISRKYELVDKHESLKNQNDISVLRFAEYIPLLIVSVKIGIDMLLVISNYL
jgi:hypothetical protein